jgi:hypothetical protein
MVNSLLVVDPLVEDEAHAVPGFRLDGDFALYRAMVKGERVFAGGQNYLPPLCFEGQSKPTSEDLLCAREIGSEATGQKRQAEGCN